MSWTLPVEFLRFQSYKQLLTDQRNARQDQRNARQDQKNARQKHVQIFSEGLDMAGNTIILNKFYMSDYCTVADHLFIYIFTLPS